MAAVLASAALLILAGCSPTPAPKHLTAAERCTPKTGVVTWQKAMKGPRESIGDYVLDYSQGGGAYTTTETKLPAKASFSYGEGAFEAISATSRTVWEQSLLAQVRRTGQVEADFGKAPTMIDNTMTPDNVKSGKYIVDVSEDVTSVPFTVSCAGVKGKLTGFVIAPENGFIYSTIHKCGPNVYAKDADFEKYCAAA
jgi:hypothetical protein